MVTETAFILEMKDAQKHYAMRRSLTSSADPVRAVDGVSLQVRPGESLGIVGESGCGKSTVAGMLLGLISPSAGSVSFEGLDLAKMKRPQLRRYRRSVQAVFQDPNSSLSPRQRIGSIVSEPLRVLSRISSADAEDHARRALVEVGLHPDDVDRFPHEFSGGQRQRIAIARAISVRPSVIVLDEPTSSLDVSIRAQIVNLLRDIQERHGIAYVVISHDLSMMRQMADSVMVMYFGKVVEQAITEDLYRHPSHSYTKELLSAVLPVSSQGVKPTSPKAF